MKIYLLSVVLALPVFFAHSQERMRIQSGDNLGDYFTYLFPSYSDGVVRLKDNTSSTLRMNFNTFLNRMQFINSLGDTMVVSNPEAVDYILLNDYLFFYDKYYYQVIDATESVKLTVCRRTTFDHVSTGPLGTTTHDVNTESYNAYVSGASQNFVIKDDVDVIRETLYYLTGKSGAMVRATKSGFMKTFPDKKKGIEAFLKTNWVDFGNLADLDKLFQFCKSSGK